MTTYSDDFYDSHRDGTRRSAQVVVPLVLGLVPARSVIDVGCGRGTWLAVFAEHGVADVIGVDGDYVSRGRLEIPPDRFHGWDLSRPYLTDRTFDLAISLEVAEHLPETAADDFVASLTRLAPVILFSAAAPYQGGNNHVNEQWPAYWSRRFADHDYLPVDCVRRRAWADPNVEWWYAQNTFLYVRRDRLESDPALWRESEAAGPHALALVHPRRYVEWVEWGLELDGGKPSARAHGESESDG
jgi:SAM-dependent methyltransferase